MPDYDPARFEPLTFHDAVPAFLDGTDTPRAYLERCLETITAREPDVQAWVTLRPDLARDAADAATARYRSNASLSPIDGMPIGVKDLIGTKDMPTGLGIEGNENAETKQDSASIRALRQAGAIILGKTVTTELGGAHPSKARNPFDPTRTAGGSSSGSGAAVGARMVPAALGTQVGGSIIRPAAFSANCALKPTFGALHRGERQGLSQSCLGVHAGSLVDMWLVAMQIAQRAGGDPGHPGLFGGVQPSPPRRPERLIVIESEGWAQTDPTTKAAFVALLERLQEAGVSLLRRTDVQAVETLERSIEGAVAASGALVTYENRWQNANLDRLLGPLLSDTTRKQIVNGAGMDQDAYRALLDRRDLARSAHRAVTPYADAIITLSCTGPAPKLDALMAGVTGRTGSPAFNSWTSMLGCPAVTVPLLAVDDMPVGVQLVGQMHEDDRITQFAQWLEGCK